ncbi:unnamed protein product [Malus baccata var. baccata]
MLFNLVGVNGCIVMCTRDGKSEVELATKQEESYRGKVNNLSQASHVSCFGHLESVDKLAFSRQLVHEFSTRKVTNQWVRDLEELTYLIGCEITGS